METLAKAIYSKFISSPHNTFYNAISGRFHFEEAPQNTSYPRAVYRFITDTADHSLSEQSYESVVVQISIFSDTQGSLEAMQAFEYMTSLFDWCHLSISSGNFVFMMRETTQMFKDPDGIWNCVAQYRVYYQI